MYARIRRRATGVIECTNTGSLFVPGIYYARGMKTEYDVNARKMNLPGSYAGERLSIDPVSREIFVTEIGLTFRDSGFDVHDRSVGKVNICIGEIRTNACLI